MATTPTRCETRFRMAAPDQLYETLWRFFSNVYPQEFRKVMAEYRGEAAITLLPHQRRARIETELPKLMLELGLTTTVEQFPNTTDTFVLVHLSEDVKLIVCYVRNQKQAVRYAAARASLTTESNQPWLIPPDEERLVLSRETLFAILAHSPADNDFGRFAEATFTFPSPDYVTGLGQLNLQREMERVQREQAESVSVVEREVEIKIKKGG